ncbi:MAG TPA: MCP four helix bundle domain-containing protein, partial [Xanthomonadaceae bacterium]|nr:MCP four helix bundle domain-containing protein [Xanthomonadaceae bacterium]
MRVGTRLSCAFGLLLLVMGVMGVVAIANLGALQGRLDEVVKVNGAKTQYLETMLDATQQVASLVRDAMVRREPAFARTATERLTGLRHQFDDANGHLQQLPASAEDRVLRTRALQARAYAKPINDRMLALLADGTPDAAEAVLKGQAAPAMQAWQDLLRADMAAQFRSNAKAYQAARAGSQRARALVLGIVGSALLLTILLAWRTTRSLTLPLAQATRVARDVAGGKLEGRIEASGRDEIAQLLASMHEMQSVLRRFAEAQAEIERRHDAGDIDHRIPASGFAGAYADMAEGVNRLAASHIAVKFKLVQIISEYAKGDLSRDMDRMPGRKAEITAAADAAKSQLLAVNAEIKALVDAAVAGDFSRRGDAQRFQFVYRDLVESLNTLM